MSEVAIVGNEGVVGTAYTLMFPDAVMYDPSTIEKQYPAENYEASVELGRAAVNACDIAIVAVPTDLNPETQELDMRHVEDVVDWLETDTILIKSALQPGTVDRLEKETGKDIAVSVEYIGEGNYHIPDWRYPNSKDPRKHQLLIVGGRDEVAEKAIGYLWARMSPDIRIHLTSAKEAEITKLAENTYGAMKVTWANILKEVCDNAGVSFVRVHQAWSEDGRVDPMHTRTVDGKRGWGSKCYDKDTVAFTKLAQSEMLDGMLGDNDRHLDLNEKED